MSRTYKDKPSKLLWGDYAQDYVYLERFHHIWRKTTKPKVRKTEDTEWKWMMSTPSWWNHIFHTKPLRKMFTNFCSDVKGRKDLEDILEPKDSRKPHKYYY